MQKSSNGTVELRMIKTPNLTREGLTDLIAKCQGNDLYACSTGTEKVCILQHFDDRTDCQFLGKTVMLYCLREPAYRVCDLYDKGGK